MGLQDRPTVPPPPDMSAEGVYINERIGDLRLDLNDEFAKLYAHLAHEREDAKKLVNMVLEKYQEIIPRLERKVAALQKAIEDELDIEIHFENGTT